MSNARDLDSAFFDLAVRLAELAETETADVDEVRKSFDRYLAVRLYNSKPCSMCRGEGQNDDGEVCRGCKGDGWVSK